MNFFSQMMELNPYIMAGVSFAASVLITYLVRGLARRYGFVAKPKADRWHKKPTAMMGGVSIYLATMIACVSFLPYSNQVLALLAGSSFLFFVGLVDDVLHVKPYQKLIGQLIGAVIVIAGGLTLRWTEFEIANIALTVFWIIGITNALNLLDNMDGLAAGIAAVAAFALALSLGDAGQQIELMLLAIFVGALVGFLVFNFNPASIFMGDCGSMFIGYFLAVSVMLDQTGGRSRSIMSVLAVPVLTLFVPIFDTSFVTVLRKLSGRAASQGGRDHTSHRLVALGLNERSAVILLYALAVVSGSLAFLVSKLEPSQSLALIGVFSVGLALLGVYLARVKVYETSEEELAVQNHAVYGFLLNMSHKRRVFEVFLDAFLIALSYYAAYVLIFGEFEQTTNWNLFIQTLPILIVVKLFALLAMGVYRGIWRYTSIRDLFSFAKGVTLGSVLSVMAILLIYRFKDFSRTVFFVDALLLFTAISVSRMAFRFLRQMFPYAPAQDGKRVLIYGAGDGGELILRELKNNPDWNYQPVGFVDDDPLKTGRVIHGLKVFSGNGSLADVCRDHAVSEILLSARNISKERLGEIKELCDASDIELKRALLKIEPFEDLLN